MAQYLALQGGKPGGLRRVTVAYLRLFPYHAETAARHIGDHQVK